MTDQLQEPATFVWKPMGMMLERVHGTLVDEAAPRFVLLLDYRRDIRQARPKSPAADAVSFVAMRECERLQGFPDDYTAIPYRGKPASDGPRYKALGNSMAVPVMRWIGERIGQVK